MAEREIPKSIRASLYIDGAPAAATIKNIAQVTTKLRGELNELVIGSDEWNQKMKQVAQNTRYLSDMRAEVNGLGTAFDRVREEIAHIAEAVSIGTLVSQGIRGILEGIKSFWNGSEEAYTEAKRTQTQLHAAIVSTASVAGESIGQLEKYQKALMDQTGVDDDVIAKGEEMLLTFTNIRGKIYEQALPAIVDMTSAMNGGKVSMEGIQSTSILVGKALNDPITGMTALKKVGVTLSEQQRTQIKDFVNGNEIMKAQAVILKELQKEFGGTAKAINDTDVGVMQQYETRIDNIKENIGEWLVKGKSLLAGFLNPFLSFVERLTTTQLSEKLQNERLAMNELVLEITSSNTATDERAKLIDKLKGMYPGYLDYLSKEKSSNDEIAKAGAKMNEMYINRIILAQKDEEIEKQNQETANLRMKRLKAESDIREQLVKLREKFPNIKVPVTGSDAEKLSALLDKYEEIQENGGKTTGGIFDPTFSAQKALSEYEAYFEYANDADKKANAMLSKRNALVKELGIDPDFKGVDDKKTPVVAPVSGPTKAEQDARAKKIADEQNAYDQLLEQARSFSSKEYADQLSANDKEIALSNEKYDAEINAQTKGLEKLKNGKIASQAQLDTIQSNIDQLKKDKQAAADAITLRQAADLTEKVNAFNQSLTTVLVNEYDKQKSKTNEYYNQLIAAISLGVDYKKLSQDKQQQIDKLEIGRQLALHQNELNEEEKFQQEKLKLKDEFNNNVANKDDLERARINKQYDQALQDLKNSHTAEFKERADFKKQVDDLEAGRTKALANVGKPKELTPEEKAKKIKDEQKAVLEAGIEVAQTTANAVFEIGKNNRDAETNAKIAQLEKQKETELNNKNLTEAQKDAINDKYAKQEAAVKLKAWKADQKASMLQAAINTALAITKALASSPPPFNFIEAAVVGAAGLAQEAVIAEQKPPQFATGGFSDTEPSGYVSKATLFRASSSGRPFVAGEAGREWIAPNWMVTSPRYANIFGMLEAARREKRAYATGGFNGPAGGGAAPISMFDVSELVKEMQLTRQAIKNQKVYLDRGDLEEFDRKEAIITRRANPK